MSDVKKEIGERLRTARERKSLRQNRVAQHLGVHNSTLAKYESGEREPDAETLLKLADLYEVTVNWIVGDFSIINNQAKNDVFESYTRLPREKQKIIDDMIKALLDQNS